MKITDITEKQHRIIDQVLRTKHEAATQGKRITEAHLGIEQARTFDLGPTGDHQIVIAGIPCRITTHQDFIGYAMEPIPPMRFRLESTNTGKGSWFHDQWMAAQPSQTKDQSAPAAIQPEPPSTMPPNPFADQAQHEAQQRQLAIQHEQERRQLWAGIAIAVAGAENARGTEVPQRWADQALKAFDQRFPAPPQA